MTVEEPSTSRTISVEVNGEVYERDVDARRLLVHFIRDDLDLTGRTSAATPATAAPAPSISTGRP